MLLSFLPLGKTIFFAPLFIPLLSSLLSLSGARPQTGSRDDLHVTMPGPKEACGKRLRLTKIGKRRNRRNTAVVDNGAFGFDEQVLEALDAHEHAPEIDFEHAARGVEIGV
jgi:hypothetical protein